MNYLKNEIFKKGTQNTSPNILLSNWADINLTYRNAMKRQTAHSPLLCLRLPPQAVTTGAIPHLVLWVIPHLTLWVAPGSPHHESLFPKDVRFFYLPAALSLPLSLSSMMIVVVFKYIFKLLDTLPFKSLVLPLHALNRGQT